MTTQRTLQVLSVAMLLLASCAVGFAQSQASDGRRVALVIGSGGYRNVDRLANPANDARLIARTLQAAGFTLIGNGPLLDLDKAQFERSVQEFGRALPGASVALFYYSGHGMQVQGVNWLVPVDANPTGTRDLDFQMVDATLVLRQMEAAGTALNLLILDACRNNPFTSRGIRGAQGGLAEMHAPEGTLISYATQPGNVAADGRSANSPYTAALADAIRKPGMDVFQVFNQVGLLVKRATGGEQQPWLASSPISGSFYFFNGPVTIAPSPAFDADGAFWQSVASSKDPADFRAYLHRFPNGTFAELAQRRIAALGVPAAAAASRAYDGDWNAILTCDAMPGGVRGWSRRLQGRVQNSVLHLEDGMPDQPNWMTIDGLLDGNGSSLLNIQGLSGGSAFDSRHAPPGTPYRYRIDSRFDGARGIGTRTTVRPCTVNLTKH